MEKHIKSAKEIFEKHADLYQDRFMDVSAYSEGLEFLSKLLHVNAEVLELACGPGNVTRFLLEQRPDLRIYGTDISPRMVELARHNNPTARFDVLDCREINNLNRKFQALVCGFCLPYLNPTEVEQLMDDIHETLVPKGILYLSAIHNDPKNSGVQTNSAGDKTMMYYYLGDQLIRGLTNRGFRTLNQYMVPRGEEQDVVIIAET